MLANLLCKGKTEAFTTANSELLTSKNCQKSPREKILVKKKTKRHRRKARKNQKIRRFKIESNRQFQGINDKDEGEELSAYKEILVPSSERDSTYTFKIIGEVATQNIYILSSLNKCWLKKSNIILLQGTRLKGKMQHFLNKLENQPSSATPDPRTPHKISEEEKFDHKFLLNRNKPSTPISPSKPLNRIPSSSPTYFSKFRPKDKSL